MPVLPGMSLGFICIGIGFWTYGIPVSPGTSLGFDLIRRLRPGYPLAAGEPQESPQMACWDELSPPPNGIGIGPCWGAPAESPPAGIMPPGKLLAPGKPPLGKPPPPAVPLPSG